MNALVTGASSGIGKEIALLLAQRGYHLVLVARRKDQLLSVAEQCPYGATIITQDLSQPQAAQKLFDTVRQQELAIEVLVNNAGFGRVVEHVQADLARLESMSELNIITLASLCRLFGAHMKEKRHGSILNVGSTAAYVPIPTMANYAASKAFVASFSKALHIEMARYGVQVCLLSPGPTLTEFGANAKDDGDFFKKKPGVMTASEVARLGVEGLFADKIEVLPGAINKLTPIAARLLPERLVLYLATLWSKYT